MPDSIGRILVVEDEPLLRQLLTTALEGRGHTVETACDGEEGLRAVRDRRPDVLITDFHMPVMTGILLIRGLREEGLRIPSILMSSNTLRELALTAQDLEGIQFLRKPFGLTELHASVQRALTHPRV